MPPYSPNPPYHYADLHMHSTFSDGVREPAYLAAELNRYRVQIAALTDHDSIDGINEFRDHFKGRVITGVELSVLINNEDVHLLAYDFDDQNEQFRQKLQLYKDARLERIYRICEKLSDLGMPIDADELQLDDPGMSYGRPHIARKMLEKNYVRSIQAAFNKFLHNHGPAYVPKYKMQLGEAVEIIHHAGGKAVIAHPGLYFRPEVIDKVLTADLDGVELWHPNHSGSIRRQIRDAFAAKVAFFSGGSDYHGNWDGRDSLALYGMDFDDWLTMKKTLN